MQKVSRIFTEKPGSVFSNSWKRWKGKCRPFMFGFEQDGKLCSSGNCRFIPSFMIL